MPVRRPLQFVTATMRLAKPVVDGDGRTLLGIGTRLDERVLRLLRQQAIQAVVVDDPEDCGGWENLRPLPVELEALTCRFESAERSAALEDLREAISRHLARRATRFRTSEEESES